jgi:hypothetical protein
MNLSTFLPRSRFRSAVACYRFASPTPHTEVGDNIPRSKNITFVLLEVSFVTVRDEKQILRSG